ncbi:AIG2 family protein [Emticicia oligotrophica DSM 17448]|uniref:AIG2 family protein n=1 Tax=Emticicia oligotrophica (strain DSM 17448 / CIP 109782 / MTCC 6937 / GPTSA100-15) TaxID=929562 RepID=A0ABN4ARS2_EMTOG|nr:gamma-glutamylcyclotransferase family protein [Emticicia oligotrophica]AFK05233.1 AIG2 family protein [Emticicia oligotrophica DSM 17448]
MGETEYLFVYGTLLSEYGDNDSHQWVRKYAEFLGKATIEGKMYMVDYYPGIIPCSKGERFCVKGELYKLHEPEQLFSLLDRYEEYNPMDPAHSEYVRKKVNAVLKNDGKTYEAWVYYFNQSVEDLEFMPKGDFLNEYHK